MLSANLLTLALLPGQNAEPLRLTPLGVPCPIGSAFRRPIAVDAEGRYLYESDWDAKQWDTTTGQSRKIIAYIEKIWFTRQDMRRDPYLINNIQGRDQRCALRFPGVPPPTKRPDLGRAYESRFRPEITYARGLDVAFSIHVAVSSTGWMGAPTPAGSAAHTSDGERSTPPWTG